MYHRDRLFQAATGICAVAASIAFAYADPACGEVLTKRTVLTADLECASDGVSIGAVGAILDCDGHAIRGLGDGAGTGIRVTGLRNVAVRNCTVEGFDTAIRLYDALSFQVANSTISENGIGVYAERSSRVTVSRTSFQGQSFHLLLRNSPDAIVRANRFEPKASGEGSLSFNRSPGARILKNFSERGAKVDLFGDSDGAVVSGNDLGSTGEIAAFLSSEVQIVGNRIGVAPEKGRDSGFAVRLTGADRCVVRDNDLAGRGIFVMSFDGDAPAGGHVRRGADRNQIAGNRVRQSAYGVYDFGGSGNEISANEMHDVLLGVLLAPERGDGESLGFGCADNTVRANRFDGGQMGIQSSDTGNNAIVGNRIRHQDVGVVNLRTDLIGVPQNVIRGNVFEANRVFGLVAYGSSPSIESNEFRRNGDESVLLPPELATLLASVGHARGGLALLPFVGWQGGSFDDGDPGNDLLAVPKIGGRRVPNTFRDNSGADVYALDTRPESADTLVQDNDFDDEGSGVRFRQDWFGLVRVVDEEGFPVEGAEVEVADSTGVVVATFASGEGGFAAADADPDRPMGLLPVELGGPVPSWTRFTEYVVSRSGRTSSLTPHRIAVRSDGRSGRACYSWDGLDNDRTGFHIASERYQTALVRLSEADWSGCHVPSARR